MNKSNPDAKDNAVNEKINDVMRWAWVLQGEAEDLDSEYLWTEPALALLHSLKIGSKGFIGLVGNRGDGKSTLSKQLAKKMIEADFKVAGMQWATTNALADTIGNLGLDDNEKAKVLLAVLMDQLGLAKFQDWLYKTFILSFERSTPQQISLEQSCSSPGQHNVEHMFHSAYYFVRKNKIPIEWTENYHPSSIHPLPKPEQLIPVLKKAINKKTETSTFITSLIENLKDVHTLFIDLPDYSSKDSRQLKKHIDLLFDLWNSIQQNKLQTNVVVSLQKEFTSCISSHMLWHKLWKYYLPKLSQSELVAVYKMRFGSYEPFTEKALLKLGQLSRGNCRYFKLLIGRIINYWFNDKNKAIPITEDFIKQKLTLEDKKEVLSLELQTIFPKNVERQDYALQVLDLLYDTNGLSQEQLIDVVGISQSACSKLLAGLCKGKLVTANWENRKKVYSIFEVKA